MVGFFVITKDSCTTSPKPMITIVLGREGWGRGRVVGWWGREGSWVKGKGVVGWGREELVTGDNKYIYIYIYIGLILGLILLGLIREWR